MQTALETAGKSNCCHVALQAAGCEDDLSAEDVDGGEVDELVKRLTQKVKEVRTATIRYRV